MSENKIYDQRVRQRAEEMGRATKPKLYEHILARYSAITLEGFIQEFIPAARLSIQREAEAYSQGYSIGRDMENDPLSRSGLKAMLQSLGLAPENETE